MTLRAIIMDGISAKKLIDKLGIILPGWSLRREEDIESIGPIGEPEVAISFIKDEKINAIFRRHFKNFYVSDSRVYEYNVNDYIIAVDLLHEEVKGFDDLVVTVLDPAIEITNEVVKAKIRVREKPSLLFK